MNGSTSASIVDATQALRESASFPAVRCGGTVTRMRTRNPDLEARWRERVETWRSSGLAAAQFAAQNGFSTSALTGWSSKLRHRPAPRPSAPPFVGVVRKDVAPVRELGVEVVGARVTQGFDPALLATVVGAIGGASCSPTPCRSSSRSST
jgi:hypothetical protein